MSKKKSLGFNLQFRSISARLLTTFIGITLGVCLILSLICMKISKDALNNLAENTLPEIAKTCGEYVSSQLNGVKYLVDAISINDEIENPSVPMDRKIAILDKYTKEEEFMRIGIADLQGNLIFNDGSKVNIKERKYFQNAVNGLTTVSNPMKSLNEKDNGAIIITYASPIKGQSGQNEAVLVAIDNAEEFSLMVKEIEIGDTGEACILDKNSNVIANKDVNLVGVLNYKDYIEKDPSLAGYTPILQDIEQRKNGVKECKVKGEKMFVTYFPIKDTDWSVVVQIKQSEVLQELGKITKSTIAITVLCLLLGGLLVYIEVKGMNKHIKYVVKNLNKIAKGDLTSEIEQEKLDRKDEFGTIAVAMKEMQDSVAEAIYSIKINTDNIDSYSENLASLSEEMSSSSDSVSSSIQDVARGTESQSTDMTDMLNTLEEFNSNLEDVMDSISEVGNKNNEIYSISQESNMNMEKVKISVEKVNDSFGELVNKVRSVEGDINKINKIISVINGIAEQTNLLALNAAIEAARAGEVGKGFAVVADEIRKLAEQSKVSAYDINNLLNNVFNETNIMVNTTDIVKEEMNSQSHIITEAITSFEKIKESVNEMIPKISEGMEISTRISKGKDVILNKIQNASSVSQEISASSEEIAAMTEEMNASSEEVASSAIELTNMTKNMKEEVQRFKLKENK